MKLVAWVLANPAETYAMVQGAITLVGMVTPSVKKESVRTPLQFIGYWADRLGTQVKKTK